MAVIPLTIYPSGHGATSSANFTDNKTAGTSSNTYTVANSTGRARIAAQCSAGGTMTVATPNTVDGLAIGDRVHTLTAGDLLFFGPYPTGDYNDADGNLNITVSANTDLLAYT